MVPTGHALEPKVLCLVPINCLSARLQRLVLALGVLVEYDEGATVFRAGDDDPYFLYLLEGELDLRPRDRKASITTRSGEALHALSQLRPRRYTAVCKTPATLFRIRGTALTNLIEEERTAVPTSVVGVWGDDEEEGGDWMSRLLSSELLGRLRPDEMQRFFAELEPVEICAGDDLIRPGEPLQRLYVVAEGECVVICASDDAGPDREMMRLNCGDVFGVGTGIRDLPANAVVRALTDGVMMCLSPARFTALTSGAQEQNLAGELSSTLARLEQERVTHGELMRELQQELHSLRQERDDHAAQAAADARAARVREEAIRSTLAIRQALDDGRKRLRAELDTLAAQTREERSVARRKLHQTEEALEHTRAQAAAAGAQAARLKAEREAASLHLDALEARFQHLKKTLVERETELRTAAGRLADRESTDREHEMLGQMLSEQRETLRKELDALDAQRAATREEGEQLQQREAELAAVRVEADAARETLAAERRALDQRARSLEAEEQERRRAMDRAERTLADRRTELDRMYGAFERERESTTQRQQVLFDEEQKRAWLELSKLKAAYETKLEEQADRLAEQTARLHDATAELARYREQEHAREPDPGGADQRRGRLLSASELAEIRHHVKEKMAARQRADGPAAVRSGAHVATKPR